MSYTPVTQTENGPEGSMTFVIDYSIVTCANCGMAPMGEACYHLCFNSPFYYSPEQERYDDMCDDGSDDRRERYAATMASMEHEGYDDEPEAPEDIVLFEAVGRLTYDPADDSLRSTSDDLPF